MLSLHANFTLKTSKFFKIELCTILPVNFINVGFFVRTNLPRQVMAFPDFPFDSSLSSFLHHDEMLQYLQDYATKFNLQQYIKVSSNVKVISTGS